MKPGDLFEALGMVRLLAKTFGDLADCFDLNPVLEELAIERDIDTLLDDIGPENCNIGVGECDEEVE